MNDTNFGPSATKRRRYATVLAILLAIGSLFGGTPGLANAPANSDQFGADWPATTPAAQQFVVNAKAALRNENVSLGLAWLRKAVNAAPRDGNARSLLGWLLLVSGDPVSAERELRQARRDGAGHLAINSLFEAMIDRREENGLLSEFPDPGTKVKGINAADILKGRSMALLSLGRTADAATTMDRSLVLNRDVSGLLVRAQIAQQQGDFPRAKKLFEEVLKLEPRNHRALNAKLSGLLLIHDYAGALKLTDTMLIWFPDNTPIKLTRVDIFLRLNEDERAKAEVDAILAKTPRTAIAHFYQAALLARSHDIKDAWREMQALPPEFLQTKPSYVVSQPFVSFAAQVAQVAIAAGEVETGAAILATGLAKTPDDLDVRLRLARLRLSQRSPQVALDVLRPVSSSTDPRVLDLLSQVYLKLGKYDDASEALKKLQRTNSRQAVALLTSALNLEPGAVELMDTLGWIELQQKNFKGALEELTRAHGLRPNDGAITFHLVQALDANGNRASAKALLKNLLDSGVEFEEQSAARSLAAGWH